jgi:hypothetical protein
MTAETPQKASQGKEEAMQHRSIGSLSTALIALVGFAAPALAAGGVTDGWAHRSPSSPSTTASFAVADLQAGQPEQITFDGWAHQSTPSSPSTTVSFAVADLQAGQPDVGYQLSGQSAGEARVASAAQSTPPAGSGIGDEVLLGTMMLLVGLGMGVLAATAYSRRDAEGLF